MAVSTTHSVTNSDVLDVLPFDASTVTASSSPLNTTLVDTWIEEAAGQLNALMDSHKIDPTTLGSDETELIQSGIIAYAVSKSFEKIGFSDAKIKAQKQRYAEVRDTVRTDPQSLGDSQSAANTIISNVDTTDPIEKKWGKDFGGW